MSTREVSAKKNDTEVKVSYDFGDNLDESVSKFGAEVVYDGFVSSAVIALQSNIRRYIEAGFNSDSISQRLQGWKPGIRAEKAKADPLQLLEAKFAGMSQEQRVAVIQRLKQLATS